jgi:hypothetical protein
MQAHAYQLVHDDGHRKSGCKCSKPCHLILAQAQQVHMAKQELVHWPVPLWRKRHTGNPRRSTQPLPHTQEHTHTHIHTYTCMHACSCTHTHTHAYMRACSCTLTLRANSSNVVAFHLHDKKSNTRQGQGKPTQNNEHVQACERHACLPVIIKRPIVKPGQFSDSIQYTLKHDKENDDPQHCEWDDESHDSLQTRTHAHTVDGKRGPHVLGSCTHLDRGHVWLTHFSEHGVNVLVQNNEAACHQTSSQHTL